MLRPKYTQLEVYSLLSKTTATKVCQIRADIRRIAACRQKIASYDDTADEIHCRLETQLERYMTYMEQQYGIVGIHDISNSRNVYIRYDRIEQYFDTIESYYQLYIEKTGN